MGRRMNEFLHFTMQIVMVMAMETQQLRKMLVERHEDM
jgi:hypothetical protein